MDGPGIESRWGARFSTLVQTVPGAHPASCTMGTGSFLGVEWPGRGADHPPPSRCRGHERVGLYLYSPSGPQWPAIGRESLNRHSRLYSQKLLISNCLKQTHKQFSNCVSALRGRTGQTTNSLETGGLWSQFPSWLKNKILSVFSGRHVR